MSIHLYNHSIVSSEMKVDERKGNQMGEHLQLNPGKMLVVLERARTSTLEQIEKNQ